MSNVLAFPGTNWRDIPKLAREMADDVEEGRFGEVTRVARVLETASGVHTLTWGESAAALHWLGMYQAAGMITFADAVGDA